MLSWSSEWSVRTNHSAPTSAIFANHPPTEWYDSRLGFQPKHVCERPRVRIAARTLPFLRFLHLFTCCESVSFRFLPPELLPCCVWAYWSSSCPFDLSVAWLYPPPLVLHTAKARREFLSLPNLHFIDTTLSIISILTLATLQSRGARVKTIAPTALQRRPKT